MIHITSKSIPIPNSMKNTLTAIDDRPANKSEIDIASLKRTHENLQKLELKIKQLESKLRFQKQEIQKETLKIIAQDKKAWFKMIKHIHQPEYAEVLITQLEARKRQLNPNWESETPRG